MNLIKWALYDMVNQQPTNLEVHGSPKYATVEQVQLSSW